MFALTNKPDMGARFYAGLTQLSTCPERGTDAMKVLQHLSGVLVETYFIFDKPDEAMVASFDKLAKQLGCEPYSGPLWAHALPPAHVVDHETERGRRAARVFFEEWLDCAFEFHDLMMTIIHNVLVSWEREGYPRAETFRLLIECTRRCMSFEIAAQELCDIAIDRKVAFSGWSLGDCITALSGIAGRRLALSIASETCELFNGGAIPDNLDRAVYVMTQEAVRLGVPAGSDWRFGLAANDVPINAPMELINGMEPYCKSFFRAIKLDGYFEQSVSCAKAAGRMIAVASGGELPEIEPAIAKPLAMSAMTESYKFVCRDAASFGM